MASVSDIDTVAQVNKFLERPLVVSRNEEGADQGEEIAAILESVAISFLLTPQTALTFILIAKNQLQQIVSKEIELLDFITKAIDDVDNPDTRVEDLSDLTEAQTALVEIDRLGSFQSATKAFQRYNAAINRFLDDQLAKSLKRRRRKEFERTGVEARQDLYTGLGLFDSTHGVMQEVLADLANSVSDFRSVNLTRVVSQKTIARVRASLRKVQRGFERDAISKTSAAIELLSGAASLGSISNQQDIFSPIVKTGELPAGRTIYIRSEPAAAFAINTSGPYSVLGVASPTLTPNLDELGPSLWNGFLSFLGNRPFVVSQPFEGDEYILTGDPLRLYVQTDHGVSPDLAFDLTPYGAGPQSVLDILTDLNTAFNPAVNVFLNGRVDGRNEWFFYGATSTTFITIRDAGTAFVHAITGAVTLSDPSAHELFGFAPNQRSEDKNFISREMTIDRLNAQIGDRLFAEPFEHPDLGPIIKVSSLSTGPESSVNWASTTTPTFGFISGHLDTAKPEALILTENGVPVDPLSLGIYQGSRVFMADDFDSSRSGTFTVAAIDGNRLLFGDDVVLPRGVDKITSVLAPGVGSVQDLTRMLAPLVGKYSSSSRDFQQVLTPLLSQQPTQAQIADAKKVVSALRTQFTNANQTGLLDILAAIVIRDDQSDFAGTAKNILSALEERNLDRSADLLKSGKFSSFFGMLVESASRGSHFLKSIEDLMTNSFKTTTIESEIDDVRPAASAPEGTLEELESSQGEK